MLLLEPSQALHLGPGMPGVLSPPNGVGALMEGKDELLLVLAERPDFLQIADHKREIVE